MSAEKRGNFPVSEDTTEESEEATTGVSLTSYVHKLTGLPVSQYVQVIMIQIFLTLHTGYSGSCTPSLSEKSDSA